MADVQANWALRIKRRGGDLHLWTGAGSLVTGPSDKQVTYSPGRIVSVTPPSATESSSASSFQFSLAVTDSADKALWLNPQGPVEVELLLALGQDLYPASWKGFVSDVSVVEGIVSVTAVPVSRSAHNRPRAYDWTTVAQAARAPQDTALRRLRSTLAEVRFQGSF